MKEGSKDRIITILLVVLLAIVAVNQYMLLTVNSVPRLLVVQGQPQQQTAQPILQTGTSQIGLPYNEQGYRQLLNYDKTIQLSDAEKQGYVGLNVELPCCGFRTLQDSGNCECGHHLALSGLAKYMIKNGYAKDQAQAEIDKWKDVFFPGSSSGNLGGC